MKFLKKFWNQVTTLKPTILSAIYIASITFTVAFVLSNKLSLISCIISGFGVSFLGFTIANTTITIWEMIKIKENKS